IWRQLFRRSLWLGCEIAGARRSSAGSRAASAVPEVNHTLGIIATAVAVFQIIDHRVPGFGVESFGHGRGERLSIARAAEGALKKYLAILVEQEQFQFRLAVLVGL